MALSLLQIISRSKQVNIHSAHQLVIVILFWQIINIVSPADKIKERILFDIIPDLDVELRGIFSLQVKLVVPSSANN